MGYPTELFRQTHVFAVERGQLVLDQGVWALTVEVNDGHVPEQCLLYLEGNQRGQVRVPDGMRKCCRLADGYNLVARANGRPKPLDAKTATGALLGGSEKPVILASLEERKVTYALSGEQVAKPRADEGVAYECWELLIADASGIVVEGAPVVAVLLG
jgi:hypothetical protein